MRTTRYMPGTSVVDITAPGGIAALLDFHRATFGDARMEAGADDDSGGNGDPAGDDNGPALNEHGFPDKTPVKDMTEGQQAAYWRHQARKHEDRVKGMADYDAIRAERDRLRASTQTDAEKAVEKAREEAREAALAEARSATLPALVRAEFKAAAAGRIPADKLAGILEPLDLTKFLAADGGEVDADKVQQYVDGIAPADGKKWPDTGQGRRQSQQAKGVGAGRELFESRHAKKS